MRSPQVTPQYRTHPQQSAAPPAILRKLASMAGVSFNGSEPWDIQVYHPETYRRILSQGSLGFGEAYMDGMWDAERLDQLFHRLLSCDIDEKIRELARWRFIAKAARHHLYNLQSINRACVMLEASPDSESPFTRKFDLLVWTLLLPIKAEPSGVPLPYC